MTKIYVGMMRPQLEDLTRGSGYLYCSACGSHLTTFEMIHAHWIKGHFDYPLYEDVDVKQEKCNCTVNCRDDDKDA